MLFEYKAKDIKGDTIEGTIEALSKRGALESLTAQKMTIISLKEEGALPIWRRPINIEFLEKIGAKDMVFLSRQISVMVSAGLPLVKSLEVLAKQTSKIKLKKIINSIAQNVRGGARFSTALSRYPKVFDDFYINMVRAGETAGKLDEVLLYLADEQEKNYDLTSKIKGAMAYPSFVILAVAGVMILMMAFVIPQLTGILMEAGVELPLTTRILIKTSLFFKKYIYYILAGIVLFFIGLRVLIKSKSGRPVWDRLILKIPVFGGLFEKIFLVRFSRSFSTLIIGGIPISSALKIVSQIVGNVVYKKTIIKSIKEVEEGRSISNSFLDAPHIPKMLSHLMAIGEQTGRLDDVLKTISNFYSREVENTLAKLVTLLEPLIIIFLGVVVGGMVAAIILPMYKLASAF